MACPAPLLGTPRWVESSGLLEAMMEYLRAAVSAEPQGSTVAAPSAAGEDEGGA